MTKSMHNVAPPGSLEAKDLEHLLHPATNLKMHHEKGPTVMMRAKGVYIWDSKGKQYLEGMAGLWCTAIGYGEEELARVASEQMQKLNYSHLFGGKSNEPSILLAEKLKAMMPFEAGRVFFGLSGSDANDTQIKLMWYYHNVIGKPERKKIISRRRGYHGVTVASGSLTGLPAFHKHFDLPIPGILHTDAPHYYREGKPGESEDAFVDRIVGNLEALIKSEGPETIAAFIAEPVMGAGGVVVPPAGYYEKVQAVLDRYGIFFIDDEVICGFGRTGNPFGAQTLEHSSDDDEHREGGVVGVSAVVGRHRSGVSVRAAHRSVGTGRHVRPRLHVFGSSGVRGGCAAQSRVDGRARSVRARGAHVETVPSTAARARRSSAGRRSARRRDDRRGGARLRQIYEGAVRFEAGRLPRTARVAPRNTD